MRDLPILDPVEPPDGGTATDPICGMKVAPATARGSATHEGTIYYFCSVPCLETFQADPRRYAGLKPGEPARSDDPTKPGDPAGSGDPTKPTSGPGAHACCGGASGSQAARTRKDRGPSADDASIPYTCPMHPEVRRLGPGSCPICGMGLEPAVVTGVAPVNPELTDMERRLKIGVVFTIPIFTLAMSGMIPGHPLAQWIPHALSDRIQFALATLVVLGCGWPFFKRMAASLRTGHLNMFTLIGLGTGTAYAYSVVAVLAPGLFPEALRGHGGAIELYFEAASVITVLVALGQVLELRARDKTAGAIRALVALAPKTARLLRANGVEDDVPLSEIQRGDRLRVRPGEAVPVDGIISEGRSAIDESLLSGEPIPVEKGPGDSATGGTMNTRGSFILEARAVGAETVLARIVRLVTDAQRSRAPIQRIADRVSAVFVPAVAAASILAFAGWLAWGPEPRIAHALVSAVSVLIIACPCALGLATPMSIMVGVGRGARLGVLIRAAEALEVLASVDTLVLDKTGTLTEGRPKLARLVAIGGREDSSEAKAETTPAAASAEAVAAAAAAAEPATAATSAAPAANSAMTLSEAELLRIAAGLEAPSEHPLAAAILQAAREKSIRPAEVSSFESSPGLGVEGVIDGEPAILGSAPFLELRGVHLGLSLAEAETLRATGHTVVFLAVRKRVAALLAVLDPIHKSAPEAIHSLRAEGLRILMLTGDDRRTALAVARTLGIDEVEADVSPTGKHEVVARLQREGRRVAMAGDGVNDAPALARADVGIAMGGGTDVALETAGITLLRGDLRGIVRARRLSRRTVRNIRQNLLFAFLYNALGVPIAAGILYPWTGILVGPMFAAAAMSLSSVSVISNALRLRRA